MDDINAYIHERRAGQGSRMLFTMHGTGGDEHQLLDLGAKLMPDATIVSPRGDVSERGAARFFRRQAEGVYDMDDLARATAKMVGFVETNIEEDQPSVVFGLGYSNGANILATALFAAPKLFDAVVLMHPLIPFEPEVDGDLKGRRVLITAGRRDPICPPEMTARLEAWLRYKGADVIVEWHEGGHELRDSEIEAAQKFLNPAGA
ncbi:MAG: alpha/beta hydrolase [Mesorhizobium sp.]